jgi:hypothetical protein
MDWGGKIEGVRHALNIFPHLAPNPSPSRKNNDGE